MTQLSHRPAATYGAGRTGERRCYVPPVDRGGQTATATHLLPGQAGAVAGHGVGRAAVCDPAGRVLLLSVAGYWCRAGWCGWCATWERVSDVGSRGERRG